MITAAESISSSSALTIRRTSSGKRVRGEWGQVLNFHYTVRRIVEIQDLTPREMTTREIMDVPLHPAVVHFPVAGAFFAAGALALGLFRPVHRAAAVGAGALLLAATFAGALAATLTGWRWADALAYFAGGSGPVPGPGAVEGLARRHALLAFAAVAAVALALGLALLARRRQGALRDDLERMAGETGDRAFLVSSVKKPAEVFQEVVRELRSRYLITFTPADQTPKSWHPVALRLRPPGLTARVRKSFLLE